MKNRDKAGDTILTKVAKIALLNFVSLVNMRKLECGLRNLQMHYLQTNEGEELWHDELLPELQLLNNFCDEMEDEYQTG